MENISHQDYISCESTIMLALQKVNQSCFQFLAVVSESNSLLGVVTDGDIRRALISGAQLTDSVDLIVNRNCISCSSSLSPLQMLSLINETSIKRLPVVDSSNKFLYITTSEELSALVRPNSPVVIMAGGKGTRLRPLTDTCPKPMLKIAGTPMLELIIKQFISSGFNEFYISVNYLKDHIIQYFGDGSSLGVSITYLNEDYPLGTAGSLSLLPKSLSSPVLITNGDVLAKIDPTHLLDFHNEQNAAATLVVRNYEHQVPFGVVRVHNKKLSGIDEKPVQSWLINTGIYVVNHQALELIPPNSYLDMPQFLELCLDNSYQISTYQLQDSWIDVGRPECLQQAIETWKS